MQKTAGRAYGPPRNGAFAQKWVTKSLFTATVRLMLEDLMLAKMLRITVSASRPETSGCRSLTSASTNSSMTPVPL